jgi:hypothetical protein
MQTAVAGVRDESSWVAAHAVLTRLARQRAAADAEEGRWFLVAWRSGAHVHLGYGSFGEYIERLFGYRPRTTQDKLRAAEALENLPITTRALQEGTLSWSAARELTRVAVPETERAWVDAARGKTVRQLEALVASRAPGDTPESPERNTPRSRVLRFEVTAETFALFREAMLHVRRSTGGAVDDDSVLLTLARQALGGAGDEGHSSHQISLEICSVCQGGALISGGERVPVGAEIVAMVECDSLHLGPALPRASNENAVAADRPEPAPVPATGGAHVGAARPRAKQTIPPAVRRAVLIRDRHCCRAPGCKNTLFVDLHHVDRRSDGGDHDPRNLVTLCSAHHRAAHRGEVLIDRSPDGNVRFRHADGAAYGQTLSPDAIDVYRKVFSALRGLGFREREVREVLEALRGETANSRRSNVTASELLREALCRIKRSL